MDVKLGISSSVKAK